LLAEAKTALVKAKSDLQRIRPLAEMNAISQMDLDAAVAHHDAAIGSLQAANAQVKQAEIELGYCRIYAPISGRVGISKVEIGEYVGGGGRSLLNLVSQVDPIRVRFSIDEKVYLRFAREFIALSKAKVEKDGERKEAKSAVELQLILADGMVHDYMGHVVSADATIDSSTGTFTMEADFPNPNKLVLSGQYARVRADIDVVKEIEERKVVLGRKINKLQVVSNGLKPGEKIVLEGVQKLGNGMTIKPNVVSFDENPAAPASSESVN